MVAVARLLCARARVFVCVCGSTQTQARWQETRWNFNEKCLSLSTSYFVCVHVRLIFAYEISEF